MEKIQNLVKNQPSLKLAGGTKHWELRSSISNAKPITRKAKVLGKPNDTTGNSQIITVGNQPEGFGSGFVWGRETDQALLVVFVNAADQLGVSIDGLKKGDLIEITSASGIASFVEDDGSFISGLIGLIGKAAEVGVSLAGFPEAVPLVSKAEEFAKDQFKDKNVKHKRRDPFGVDPSTGQHARAEGGVLVCLTGADGVYYSGNSDHKERWIKDEKPRTYKNLPSHFLTNTAFFLNREIANSGACTQDGQAYIIVWDSFFEDNAGYYKIFVRLTKAKENPPIPKKSSGTTVIDHRTNH